jgi:fibronectin-binding autotransporter adhesin
MKPARAFLQVVLSAFLVAALVASSGFGATKKFDRQRTASEDWNDSPLISATLLSTGSSVASGVGPASLSIGSLESRSLVLSPGTPDNWNGGTGNWSVPGNWSAGAPGASSDVTIYSGGNDLVTLDTSPAISSLVLGSASNGTTSELTDGGVAQTLTLTNGLTVGQTGYLQLTGGSAITVGADSSNAGYTDLENASTLGITGNFTNTGVVQTGASAGGNKLNITGILTNSGTFELDGAGDVANVGMLNNTPSMFLALVVVNPGTTLNLTNQPNGITDIVAGSELEIGGTFNAGANSGLYQLTSIEGSLILFGGRTTNVTPMGGTLNISIDGYVNVESGSTLQINGNVNNSFVLATYPFGGIGGNVIDITGTLTNQGGGFFALISPGDAASIGSLTNFGQVDVESASTLQITGGTTNFGTIATNLNGYGGGNTLNITGMLTNSGTFQLNGPADMATLGGLINSGLVNVQGGSTLQVNGDVNNSGTLGANPFGNGGGGNTITITGNLTNSGTVDLYDVSGNTTMSVTGNVVNSGFFFIENTVFVNIGMLDNTGIVGVLPSSTLNLTNQPTGITDIVVGSTFDIGGTFTAGPYNAFYRLTSVEGTLDLYNQQTTNVTPMGGLLTIAAGGSVTADSPYGGLTLLQINGDLANAGTLDLERGSSVQITGNFDNSGRLVTNTYNLGGMNTVTVGDTLTNNGTFELNGVGDMAMLGNLDNNSGANVNVNNGSSLIVNGNVNNAGNIVTDPGGNTITISGMLTNSGVFELSGPGDMASIGSLKNSGFVDVEHGGTFQVNGDALNTGYMATDYQGFGGGNKVNITGTLNNQGGNNTEFVLNGPNDMASLGGLTNSGFVDVTNGSALQINGNAANFGALLTGEFGNGGNKLTITGNLTNDINSFGTFGSGDMLTIGGSVTNGGGLILLGAGSAAIMGTLSSTGLVDVSNGSSLRINGDVSNSGEICTNCANGFYSSGNRMAVTGTLTNAAGGQIYIGYYYNSNDSVTVGNGFVNSGLADVEGGSTLQITGNATNAGTQETDYVGYGGSNALNIGGNLTNETGGQFILRGFQDVSTIGGNLDNSGTLEQDNTNTITVNGLLTNTATGTITLNGPGDVLSALAGLNNSGVLNVYNGSSIVPPTFNNLGTLNIDGTSRFVVGTPTPMGGQGYIQTANGTLGEMIASLTSFGVINVNGSALLNGTLDVLLQGGYNPGVGSMYKFLNFTPGELSGMFANIPANGMFTSDGEQWMITYDNADGYVELTAEGRQVVSEPDTLLVLIPGLLGMGYGLRRKLLA